MNFAAICVSTITRGCEVIEEYQAAVRTIRRTCVVGEDAIAGGGIVAELYNPIVSTDGGSSVVSKSAASRGRAGFRNLFLLRLRSFAAAQNC